MEMHIRVKAKGTKAKLIELKPGQDRLKSTISLPLIAIYL